MATLILILRRDIHAIHNIKYHTRFRNLKSKNQNIIFNCYIKNRNADHCPLKTVI